jgi:hypothetical protein
VPGLLEPLAVLGRIPGHNPPTERGAGNAKAAHDVMIQSRTAHTIRTAVR